MFGGGSGFGIRQPEVGLQSWKVWCSGLGSHEGIYGLRGPGFGFGEP